MSAVLIDFNDHKEPARPQHDKEDLKRRLEARAREVLTYLWPAGRPYGTEYHVGDIHGAKGHSLKISLKPGKIGVGCDFSGNEVCGDLLDCWAYARHSRKVNGHEFALLLDEVAAYVGAPPRVRPAPAGKAEKNDLGPPTAAWAYTDPDGCVLHEIVRYDPPGRKKEFRQHPRLPENGRPLYNLPQVVKAPQVVFVEGEKSAEALIKVGIVATCTIGGSSAPAEKTDWSPLARRRVIVWPDADEPGFAYAEAVRTAAEAAGATVIVLQPPPEKAEGWDAADAIAEGTDPREILRGFEPRSVLKFRLADCSVNQFEGEPSPIRWLIQDLLPLGKAGLLVAMGDAGKGILTLDLALKITCNKQPSMIDGPTCMGGEVIATGAVVILAAEDDHDTIHRRLHSLDPSGERRASGRFYVVPLPNRGGPVPIVKTSSTSGPYVTPEWTALKSELLAIPNLRLVVLDPLASFVHADVNADPAAGAFVTGQLASLATETGATVLLPHHMAKRTQPITTPEEARNAIRGSTAIVDGVRFAYALWPAAEADAKRICKALGEEWQRNRVLKGCIVKSNDPADRTIRSYVRSLSTGLLIDRTDVLKTDRYLRRENELDELEEAVAAAASRGYPYTYSGSTGLYERRGELPVAYHDIGKHSLRALADELLIKQRLARVRHTGQTSQWLDRPKGDFAMGKVALAPGAHEVDDVPGK